MSESPESGLQAEQRWLDKSFDNCQKCYNINPKASSALGLKWSANLKRMKSRQTKAQWKDPVKRARLVRSIALARLTQDIGAKISAGRLKAPPSKRSASARAGGFAVWKTHREKLVGMNSKTYHGVISPSGEEFRNIHNLSAFCREHGLDVRSINAVCLGKTRSHKDWRAIYAPQFSI